MRRGHHVVMPLWDAPVLDVRPLLAGERAGLIEVLTELTTDEWAAATCCPGWAVKDIALHILGEELGWLSRGRDGDPTGLLDEQLDHRAFVQVLDEKNQ